MNWTEEYLIPPIESDSLSFELLKKIVSDIRELVPHALKPHKSQVSPKKPLPKVPSEDAETAKACERIYDASLTRIDTLEKKALGLLSYVTALFALLFFAYSQFGGFQGTYWLLLPLSLLVVTLVISFRCLSVKAIQHIFVDDIYNFDDSGTAT